MSISASHPRFTTGRHNSSLPQMKSQYSLFLPCCPHDFAAMNPHFIFIILPYDTLVLCGVAGVKSPIYLLFKVLVASPPWPLSHTRTTVVLYLVCKTRALLGTLLTPLPSEAAVRTDTYWMQCASHRKLFQVSSAGYLKFLLFRRSH